MAYIINRYNGEALLTLQDGTVDVSTSVQLVGRNYVGYGEIQNENFLFLMENFSNDFPPSRPLSGQTWFDSDDKMLNVFDGERWAPLGVATVSLEPPIEPTVGMLWFKSPLNTLHVYSGTEWVLIGPDTVDGFGITRAESTTLKDDNGQDNPVILLTVNGIVTGICSSREFTLAADELVTGFSNIAAGITLPTTQTFSGSLLGVASSATKLETLSTINGVGFNGTENITITAASPEQLAPGNHIEGNNYDGSSPQAWSVIATHENQNSKIVMRDVNGDFAARIITAKLAGNVTAPSGTSEFDIIEANQFIGASFSGNAQTATRISPAHSINNTVFDGSHDVTISANAETLTGSYINSSVNSSNLQTLGTLLNLDVHDAGITVGTAGQLTISSVGDPSIESTSDLAINVTNGPHLSLITEATSLSVYGYSAPALISENLINLGLPTRKFDNVHANIFHGTATSAQFADLAEFYSSDVEYEPGTVLIFGGDAEVTVTDKYSDSKLAGVVTTNPGLIMNTELQGTRVCMALQGRVPVKTIGVVTKGDMLTTSSVPGYAEVAKDPAIGTVIGKALESKSTLDKGVIEVSISKM